MECSVGIILVVLVAMIHAQPPPGPECPPTIFRHSITEAERRLILDTHNRLRSRVALGLETRGNPGPQPPASNMRALVWDNELAFQAELNVHQCVMRHDSNLRTHRGMPVGQNLASQSLSPFSQTPDWSAMIEMWYNEVDRRNPDQGNLFPISELFNIGHYTQVVWADTDQVGCSVLTTLTNEGTRLQSFRNFYACNYSPSGNFRDRPVYVVGRPASACPPGTNPDVQAGLCR